MRPSLQATLADMTSILDAALPYDIPIFTLGGVHYCSVPGEERFNENATEPNKETSITALQVMKNVLPSITKSRTIKPQPPDPFFLVGLSSRRKITRAFQLWYDAPPVTEATTEFLPFFEHLSSGVPDRWEVQQEFGACRWATKYQDNELATSLLLHFGYAPDYKVKMPGNSIHRLIQKPDGVTLDIEYVHTFQDRIEAACAAIQQHITDRKLRGRPLLPADAMTAGMMAFSYHNKRYCSITKEYRMMITNKLTAYVEESINALETDLPLIPHVEEPEDMVEDQVHHIRFSDFVIPDGPSDAKRNQLHDISLTRHLNAILPKLEGLPRGVPIKRCDFPSSFTKDNFLVAVREGILLKPKYAHYLIPEEVPSA